MSQVDSVGNGPESFEPDVKIAYKSVDGPGLHLHVFKPDGHGAADRRPCIVFFFGGGWVGGTPTQFYPHSRYLASRGMVAVAAEYRTESSHGTTPYQCVSDGKSAMRWVRAHASDLGVDPGKVAAGGGSAGGHVAAACAAVRSFDEKTDDLSVSPVPAALVMFNPVYDNGPDGWGYDRVEDQWREISPLHNISEGHPPAVVFFGTEDNLVPVSTAEAYRDRLEDVGSRCDLLLYPGQQHAFFNYGDGKNPYYAATVYETDRFLESLGYTAGAPSISREQVEVIEPSNS